MPSRLTHGFRVGDWFVEPLNDSIRHADGREQHLQPKVMDVLVCLAEHAGEPVSRDELISTVWGDRIVTDEPLTRTIAELRRALCDDRSHPCYIETIPKRGYRLVSDVRETSDASDKSSSFYELTSRDEADRVPRRPAPALAAGFLLAIGLSAVYLLWLGNATERDSRNRGSTGVPPANSIAVLAFSDLSPNGDNTYFAEGISEEILNALARIDRLAVTSRASAFSYRDTRTPIAEIARQLQVAYVLDGTVRKQGNSVRIAVELINAETDKHVWSDSYDRNLSDVFQVQEDIARSVVVAMGNVLGIEGAIAEHEVKVRVPTRDIEGYQHYLHGRQLFFQRGPALDDAIESLRFAVRRDPDFVEAWSFLAAAASVAIGYPTTISDADAETIADEASTMTLRLDADNALALGVRSDLAALDRDLVNAFELSDRAVTADPENSTILLWAGQMHHLFGYLGEALVYLKRAVELDPMVGINNGVLAMIYLAAGRDDLAEPLARRSEARGWFYHIQTKFNDLVLSGDVESAIQYSKSYTSPSADPNYLHIDAALANGLRSRTVLAVADLPVDWAADMPHLGICRLSLFPLPANKDLLFRLLLQEVSENPHWQFVMRCLWLPGSREYIEDPRFLAVMSTAGVVDLWEQRGYPDGCSLVEEPTAAHLDCGSRYPR